MSQTTPLHIALIADMNTAEQTLTLIKSICFHHPHVVFHILNQNINEEWFSILNQYLEQFKCEAIDVSILPEHMAQFEPLNPSMTLAGYFKLLIPQLVDNDRVLFISTDCIVNGLLTDFYKTDLTYVALAGVHDLFLDHLDVTHPKYADLKPYFNSQVILFNCEYWKNDHSLYANVLRVLQEQKELAFAEQDILNLVCYNGGWKPIHKLYNLQVGVKRLFAEHGAAQLGIDAIETHKQSPVIVYYSYLKPWHKWKVDDIPYFDLYWFYYALEWEEVIQKRKSSISARLLDEYYQ